MGRMKLAPRQVEVESLNIGRLIIFTEGETEANYLHYFISKINERNVKYNEILVEVENAKGNAQTVFNHAESFLEVEDNQSKYMNHEKYLMFDCDDPQDIQNVISNMLASEYKYKLLVSNYMFETWLLMHFEEVEIELKKPILYQRLGQHLDKKYSKYKGNLGIIYQILQQGNLNKAIENAKKLDVTYEQSGDRLDKNIVIMNPYCTVYKLIEEFNQFLNE